VPSCSFQEKTGLAASIPSGSTSDSHRSAIGFSATGFGAETRSWAKEMLATPGESAAANTREPAPRQIAAPVPLFRFIDDPLVIARVVIARDADPAAAISIPSRIASVRFTRLLCGLSRPPVKPISEGRRGGEGEEQETRPPTRPTTRADLTASRQCDRENSRNGSTKCKQLGRFFHPMQVCRAPKIQIRNSFNTDLAAS
jgi:hypothetical protein